MTKTGFGQLLIDHLCYRVHCFRNPPTHPINRRKQGAVIFASEHRKRQRNPILCALQQPQLNRTSGGFTRFLYVQICGFRSGVDVAGSRSYRTEQL
jgi:hypothetical protein